MPNRLDTRFEELRNAGVSALAPFITVGYPSVEMSLQLAETILTSGGDLLEIGIPFSDPLADGPTVQRTSYNALLKGANIGTALDIVRRLRNKGIDSPLVFLGYFNPFLRYGLEKFIIDAVEAGADGLIVPDMPTEESAGLRTFCEKHGIHLIPLLAPTSTDARIADACKHAKGFIYCVSLTGVTGARQSLSEGLAPFIARVRQHTKLPILVGFGVSSREHVEEISKVADGAIVASALLDAIDNGAEGEELTIAARFVRDLKGL